MKCFGKSAFWTVLNLVDVEIKLRHIQKYIDMHVGTLDFDLGLITGIMMSRFRLMLRQYRVMSNVAHLQRENFQDLPDEHRGRDFFHRQIIVVSCFLSILVFKQEFTDAVDSYMKIQKDLKKKRDECKKMNVCRRSLDQDLGVKDFEFDYFGHKVPKETNTKKDRAAELLLLEENSVDIPFEKLPKIILPNDGFEKINDWLRYLANGGMRKNKNKKIEDDDDFDLFTSTEYTTLESMTKDFKNMPTMPPYRHFNFESPSDIQMTLEKSKKTRIPWGKRGSDFEYKKKLRHEYFERMRGGFDPKREGIDINLEDIF